MFVPETINYPGRTPSLICEVCSICKSKNQLSPKPVQYIFSGAGHAKRKHDLSPSNVLSLISLGIVLMVRKYGRILSQVQIWMPEEVSLDEMLGEGNVRVISFDR